MQTRALGSSGERVGAIGFGCMGLVGWYGTRDDAEARATLLAAIDSGITHLDTAASYQQGENERFVGASVRERRKELFVATKFGITRSPQGALRIDNRPEAIRASVDASLQRLGFGHVDLFYLHRIDQSVPIEESVGALADLVREGKIRHIGLSECSTRTLRRACAVHAIAAVQSEYSLWAREPEDGMLAACRELGVSFVAYSPLGRGFLAGNFRSLSELPAGDHRRPLPRYQDANVAHNARIAGLIGELAKRKGCTAAQISLAWVLAQGRHVMTIPGMKTRAHLKDNLGALDVRLSEGEQQELRAQVAAVTVQGDRHAPAMMQAIDRDGD